MKKKLKLLISSFMFLSLITACSFNTLNSPKTYPSLDLPYVVVDEEVDSIKDEGLEEYTEKQILKEVSIRDFTKEETKRFSERIKYLTQNDLNNDYLAVEFYFGSVTKIDRNKKAFIKFDEDLSDFIYDDNFILDNFYQIPVYEKSETLLTGEKNSNDREIGYGVNYENLKIVTLINKEHIKKGLQFKTIINEEVVYIDIK